VTVGTPTCELRPVRSHAANHATAAGEPTWTPASAAESTPGPAAADAQPGLPNRRRLGHPLKSGDLTQSG